ncbi:MAG: FAD-dependent oxidoreductase [Gemmatimonadaceae bacterium]
MLRSIGALESTHFDVLVVGGGILGASIARDSALRGLTVALVERGDFAGATSGNSLKIIHGGLRYLQHLDIARVRSSIRERSTWLRIAPHLVEALPVLVPCYPNGLRRRSLLRLALLVNDAIGWDTNETLLPERQLPRGRALSYRETLDLVPELDRRALSGGVLFHDAQMYSSERVVLEVIQSAAANGARIVNHAEVDGPLMRRGCIDGTRVRDRLTGDRFELRARCIVNAAGPATASVAAMLLEARLQPEIAHSVALNVMIPSMQHRVAFALSGETSDPDAIVGLGARQLFFTPWRGRTIIGTGHYPHDGDAAAYRLSERDVQRFIGEVNSAWRGAAIQPENVVLVHSGLIPGATGPGVQLLKRDRVIDHRTHGAPALISVVGIKFTTSRRLAERVVDLVLRKLGRAAPSCRTATITLPGAPASLEALRAEAAARSSGALPPDILEHLLRTYGREYTKVLAYRATLPAWNERVDPGSPVIIAQLAHAVDAEMAQTVEDVLLRRVELGARDAVTQRAVDLVEEFLASFRNRAAATTIR